MLPDTCFRLLLAVTASQVISLVTVAKHSAPHYLLPALNLSGVLVFLLYKSFTQLRQHENFKVPAKSLKLILIPLVILIAILSNPISRIAGLVSHLERHNEKGSALHQLVTENYRDYGKVYYYRCSSPEYALKFGSDLSRSYHAETLQKLYPNVWFYDIWLERFMNFDYNSNIPFNTISSKYGNKIVFQGTGGQSIPGVSLMEVSEKSFEEGVFEYKPEELESPL
jgi:hypothetical protein